MLTCPRFSFSAAVPARSRALPELDVELRGLREVGDALDVEHLLHLRPSLHQGLHRLGLNVEL